MLSAKQIKKRKARMEKFCRGLQSVMRDHMRNPSVSGTMPHSARLVDGSGSDARKAMVLTGYATKPFMTYNRSMGENQERKACNPDKCPRHGHDTEHA